MPAWAWVLASVGYLFMGGATVAAMDEAGGQWETSSDQVEVFAVTLFWPVAPVLLLGYQVLRFTAWTGRQPVRAYRAIAARSQQPQLPEARVVSKAKP